ncbi:MAG: cell division protein FtsQ/DivIB [Ancrocorticia sp.]
MKPPKRIGKPRSLAAQTVPEVPEPRTTKLELVAQLRQDGVPTAALSPEEAQEISRVYGVGNELGRSGARQGRDASPEIRAVDGGAARGLGEGLAGGAIGGSTGGSDEYSAGDCAGGPAESEEMASAGASSAKPRKRRRIAGLAKRAAAAGAGERGSLAVSESRVESSSHPERSQPWGSGEVSAAELGGTEDFLLDDDPVQPVVQLSARRREKLAERRRLILKRIVIVVLTVALGSFATWALFFSSLFALRQDKIEVAGLSGSPYLTNEQVTESLLPLVGTPLPRLTEKSVSGRLTSDYSIVKSVDLSRHFPRGVGVEVTLREPVACLMEGGACHAIDTEGVILDLAPEQTQGLPQLTLAAGQDAAGDAAEAMIDVLAALPDHTRAKVASIEVSESAQITLKLSDGATVAWGTSGNNEFKSQVLEIILKQEASRYDVSAPSAPVTS